MDLYSKLSSVPLFSSDEDLLHLHHLAYSGSGENGIKMLAIFIYFLIKECATKVNVAIKNHC